MIKQFIYNGSRYVPGLICGHCKLQIKSHNDGVTFSTLHTTDTGVLTPYEQIELTGKDVCPEEHDLVYLHKACEPSYRREHDCDGVGGDSLNDHFYKMLRDLGLNPAGLENPDQI